ncbi:MAG: peptidyl-prolyl cis-trans isomerase [Ectothiorhodospiraceae bacterium]|nr:peptidyl-prolyl cis-trans isomerase [Ectothiorhodospiraceae bacterium]
MIRITTTMGNIDIELDFDKAPKSAANFEQYVKDGHFDGTIFHRVINNFMIQGGGMLPDMSQKETRATIENEADNGLKNIKGTLAMARTNDPHSASSQFFINIADNAFLDHTSPSSQGWGYAVFGKVVDGMDVVETMKEVTTTSRAGHQDVPTDDIIIEKMEIMEAE